MKNYLVLSAMLLLFVFTVVLGVSSVHAEITIRFDDIDIPSGSVVEVTNQYQSQGVIFEDLIVLKDDWSQDYPISKYNVGIIDDDTPYHITVTVKFVDPVTGSPAVTDKVEALFLDSNVDTNLVTMRAFDCNGNQLDWIEVTTPAVNYDTVGLNVSGIHRVTMTTDDDGSLFDDFTFNEVQPCPCDPCEGDFDRDGDVDGSDLALFAADFGRTDCPIQYVFGKDTHAMGVPATGQTTCYDGSGNVISCPGTGQDGDWQKGMLSCSPRFIDNGDGTVTDNFTGLIWLKDAGCNTPMTWADALSECNNLADGSCGLTDGSDAGDWRLPNRKELESLLDLGNHSPALPSSHPFTSVQLGLGYYWSATTYASYTNYAWYVSMSYGYVSSNVKSSSYYVWPVRAGN